MRQLEKSFALFAGLGFLFGVCLSIGLIQFGVSRYSFDSVQYHWRKVNEYTAYMANPANFGETSPGLIGTRIPFDLEPHLTALAAAGEIDHVDLILPNVPNTSENNRLWMEFCDMHQDTIIEAIGNGTYAAYPVEGEAPLHLQLWFRKSGSKLIQTLIHKLQENAKKSNDIDNNH